MTEISKQIEAKIKAFKVISSSNTLFQLCSANTYVELYFKQYEDLIGYEELNQVLLEKYKTTCE